MARDKASQNLNTRLGGLMLAVAAFSLIPIIIEYVIILSALTGTGPGGSITTADSAAHASSHWIALSRGWRFEVFAVALMAAAALTLMERPGNARLGWALVAIGALVACPMYALMLGGYDAALHGVSVNLKLYAVLRASAFEFFYSGFALMRFGLAAVFFVETAKRGPLLWRGLFMLGFVTNLVHGAAFMALFWGAKIPMAIIGPFGLVGFILVGVFGLKLLFENQAADK